MIEYNKVAKMKPSLRMILKHLIPSIKYDIRRKFSLKAQQFLDILMSGQIKTHNYEEKLPVVPLV